MVKVRWPQERNEEEEEVVCEREVYYLTTAMPLAFISRLVILLLTSWTTPEMCDKINRTSKLTRGDFHVIIINKEKEELHT